MDLIQQDNRITGRIILEGAEYHTHGVVNADGSMHDARAGKSAESQGIPGPRFLKVSLDFSDLEATGHYAAETSNPDNCATAVELKRYTVQ